MRPCYNFAGVAAGSKQLLNDAKDSVLPSSGVPADLRERIRCATQRALRAHAIEPIRTRVHSIDNHDIRFSVRVAEPLERKRREQSSSMARANPFLPYDEELFVAGLADTHVCLLNKFNVLDDHALIVTRDFESQESPLGVADFRAAADCLESLDGLVFYNGGRNAGASQPHKHLQIVPTPIADGPWRVPIEPSLGLDDLLSSGIRVSRSGALPFRHALVRIDDCMELTSAERAAALAARYGALLEATRCSPPSPYNLLATRAWMLIVPRTRESSHGIEVNSLGIAGAFFARDHEQLMRIASIGPMQLLRDVCFPA